MMDEEAKAPPSLAADAPSPLYAPSPVSMLFGRTQSNLLSFGAFYKLFKSQDQEIMQVESVTNQEEVELRAKIEALGLEVTKVPSKSANLNEMEIAKELDRLSAKLDDVDEMISTAMADDPNVRSFLSSTSDMWMPVITATSEERLKFSSVKIEDTESSGKDSELTI